VSDTERVPVVGDAVEQEIKNEQAVVDRIYARLEAASASARQLAAEGHARASVGNFGGLVERDAIVFQAGRRLASLDAAHDGLVFGRLDLSDREIRYVGRLGLRDANRDILLVDWRAPAAAVFYQATAQDPAGVVRRRVLQSFTDRVIGVEDDLLDPGLAPEDMVIVGDGALIAALARSRERSMQSIVATIQKEQDDAIRSPHQGVTTISGGPGTGKTVVALHRAAYLLYTDRRRFESGGVLVVGPNSGVIAYIERVLPSLGETTVSLRALGEVVEGIRATRHDSASVARIKGSARMRQVLSRTVRGELPGGPTAFRVFYRDDVLRLDRAELAGLRRRLLSGGQRRNRAAAKVSGELISLLWERATGDRAREHGRDAFARTMRDDGDFVDFVESWWPVVDALEALADHDELVTPQPREGVARPNDGAQLFCDVNEGAVACGVAERVVDGLESVEVHVEKRDIVRGRERPLDALHRQHAVRQAGESVVQRLVAQLRLGALAKRDVLNLPDDVGVGGVFGRRGGAEVHLHPELAAVGVNPVLFDRSALHAGELR